MQRIAFGGPWYHSQVDTRLLISVVQLTGTGPQVGLLPTVLLPGDGMLDLSRNVLLAQALGTDCDWYVSFDADCSFIGQIAALATTLAEHNQPNVALVAAPVRLGQNSVYNVVLDDQWPSYTAEMERPTLVQDVARIGFAFVAFRLQWYREKWPRIDGGTPLDYQTFFQTTVVPDGHGSFKSNTEDYFHCVKVHNLDGRMVCDPRLRVKHHIARAGSPEAETE